MGNVLTWRQPILSGGIVAALMACSFCQLLLALDDLDKGHWLEHSRRFAKYALRRFAIYACEALGIWILFCQAPWFQWIRSSLKVCMRLATMRRKGPEEWSFFRPETSNASH